MMERMLIAGNWKMNGELNMARKLAKAIREGSDKHGCEYLICPPATALSTIAKSLKGSVVSLGGQDCHAEVSGAHTGDISARMLSDIGCKYVIVGHSERRSAHMESDETVKVKAETAQAAGLTAIICVGESNAQRELGDALSVVETQVTQCLPNGATSLNTVIAYEPIWAIGTGKVPTLEQITEMHLHIQSVLNRQMGGHSPESTKLLYGGSVNAENADKILRCAGVMGALVGGASLKANSFLAIGQSCP
jgi:triosephosphate isomerase